MYIVAITTGGHLLDVIKRRGKTRFSRNDVILICHDVARYYLALDRF